MGAQHRDVASDVMVDQGLEPGDSHEAAKLTPRVEETNPGRKIAAAEIGERDQAEGQANEEGKR